MKSKLFSLLLIFIMCSAFAGYPDSGGVSGAPKLEVVFRNDDLTVSVVNDSVDDIEISYPFLLSYGGGAAGDLDLVFRPVGRRPALAEGRLCAAIQQTGVVPSARILWAGSLFGQRFDISHIKGIFCLKKGSYDLYATLYINNKKTENSISSAVVRVSIK